MFLSHSLSLSLTVPHIFTPFFFLDCLFNATFQLGMHFGAGGGGNE